MILVNLTCGRNPWKRASIDDSTFRAYLKNPRFLSSILPLSPELDVILRRIFECVPERRISIAELRELILRCPRFTINPGLPPSPPCSVDFVPQNAFGSVPSFVNPFQPYHTVPYTPAPSPPAQSVPVQSPQLTLLSTGSSLSDDGSVYSSSSSSSSMSDFEPSPESNDFVTPEPAGNFYGNLFPAMDWNAKPLVQQPCEPTIHMY